MIRLFACIALASSIATPLAIAQPQQNSTRRMPSVLRNAPAVGEQLPDVQVYSDTGEPVRTHLLKGRYTVLVFGCLT